MARRRGRRFAALAGISALVIAAGGWMVTEARSRRHRAVSAPSSHALPAGGVAAVGPDARTDPDTVLVEDGERHDVRIWSFALAEHELRIEDVAMSSALDVVLDRTRAALVVNGGFFDPASRPLGLAMSDGAVLSRLARSASGGVLTWDGERGALWEAESFTPPEGTRFAVQCRPRLVVDREPNVRSDDGKRSERTALCLRDGGATLDVVVARSAAGANASVPGPSLYALARHLAAHGCEGALNLDGGPSTGAAWRAAGGAIERDLPRAGVRHAIVVREKR